MSLGHLDWDMIWAYMGPWPTCPEPRAREDVASKRISATADLEQFTVEEFSPKPCRSNISLSIRRPWEHIGL